MSVNKFNEQTKEIMNNMKYIQDISNQIYDDDEKMKSDLMKLFENNEKRRIELFNDLNQNNI